MDGYLKILTIALVGCAAALFLQDGSFRRAAALCCCALCALASAELLRPVLDLTEKLYALSGVGQAVFAPVLKAGAIGLLTQTGAAYCADVGEKAVAEMLELGGVISILYVSLPLFSAVLDMLETLMGG